MQPVAVQPTAVQHTTLTVVQPNGWSSGICDCCDDMGICCCAFWCFPCFECRTVSDFGECLCLPLLEMSCAGYAGCSPYCPPVSMAMRAAVRERYRIQGTICDDCCLVCCCLSCTWCQMAREIKKRKQPVSFMTAQTTMVTVPMNPQFYQASAPLPYPPK
ncbi:cornifelin homolog [Gastrophryne carolinensis]